MRAPQASRDHRPSAAARGYDARWRRIRARILRDRPVCEECRSAPSVDVDHIIPRSRGGSDRDENLQALCHPCHSRKTAKHDGGFGKKESRLRPVEPHPGLI